MANAKHRKGTRGVTLVDAQRTKDPMDPVAMVNRRVDKNLAGYSDAFAERDRLKAAEAAEKAQRSSDQCICLEWEDAGGHRNLDVIEACPAHGNRTSNPRAAFEKWLLDVQGLTAEWQEHRNCYKEFPAHLAWRAWSAALANETAGGCDWPRGSCCLLRGDKSAADVATPREGQLIQQPHACDCEPAPLGCNFPFCKADVATVTRNVMITDDE